jgi:hypothetical protein
VVETTCVPLRGLAQLVFAERVDAGVLVLLAIALVSPWCALGSFLGSVFGSVAGRVLPIYTRTEWRLGLAGFNGAIIGILWGGFFASGAPRPLLFAAALTLCVLMEAVLRALLRPLSLPPLSMPAVLAAMLIDSVLAPPGTWFWMSAGAPPLGTGGIYAAIVCVVLAAATRHQAATLQALVLAAVAMWLATSVPGLAPPDSSGLWAFAVAPASFAAQALLAPGVLAGRLAGLAAAVLAAGWPRCGCGATVARPGSSRTSGARVARSLTPAATARGSSRSRVAGSASPSAYPTSPPEAGATPRCPRARTPASASRSPCVAGASAGTPARPCAGAPASTDLPRCTPPSRGSAAGA